MTRLQRLCLDAVERCGDPYLSTLNTWEYVRRRRWWTSISSVHTALYWLYQMGYLDTVTVPGGPERGYNAMRVYKRTHQIDHGETVPLAAS